MCNFSSLCAKFKQQNKRTTMKIVCKLICLALKRKLREFPYITSKVVDSCFSPCLFSWTAGSQTSIISSRSASSTSCWDKQIFHFHMKLWHHAACRYKQKEGHLLELPLFLVYLLTFTRRKNSLHQFFDGVVVHSVRVDVATELMEVPTLKSPKQKNSDGK